MTEKPRFCVACGIVWQGETFLAAERPVSEPRGGLWEFPGGKQEPGETLHETLKRELREELAIECFEIQDFCTLQHTYRDIDVTLYFMHVLRFSGQPSPELGQKLRWVTVEEARTLPFLPADIQILEKLTRPDSPTVRQVSAVSRRSSLP